MSQISRFYALSGQNFSSKMCRMEGHPDSMIFLPEGRFAEWSAGSVWHQIAGSASGWCPERPEEQVPAPAPKSSKTRTRKKSLIHYL